MASGHQSRPASARVASSVSTSAPLSARRSSRPSGSGDDGAGEPIGDRTGLGIDRRDRRGSGHGRSSPAVRSSFWQASMKSLAWSVACCSSHPSSAAMSVGRGVGGRHGGLGPLDHGAGPPGQHVVERLRHLLAGRVDQLGPGVGQAGDDGFEQLGSTVGQSEDGRGLGSVAAEEVRTAGGPWRRDPWWPWSRRGGGAILVTQRRVFGDSPSCCTTTSTVSCAIFR